MRIPEFITYNRTCPVCEEPLTLYLQWNDSLLFKAKEIQNKVFEFEPTISTSSHDKLDEYKQERVLLDIREDFPDMSFTSNQLLQLGLKYNMYLFYLCNPSGIKTKSWGDYEIEAYNACYYRSSPFFELDRDKRGVFVKMITDEHKEILSKDECFSLKAHSKECEKVYIVNLDHIDKETTLWYYTVSNEQKETLGFKPNLFEKKLPLLKSFPKLTNENRDKFIERLDSWIIMS